MKKLIHKMIFAATISLGTIVCADNTPNPEAKTHEQQDIASYYQKIIDEYKTHLASVPAPVREEIKTFRTEIAKLQKQKRDLYKKLSVEAQDYLKTEEKFRQRLPIIQSGKIDLKQQGEIKSEQSNK